MQEDQLRKQEESIAKQEALRRSMNQYNLPYFVVAFL